MTQKELLKLGEQKLKSKKIEEAYYKAKIVLNYILNQTAEQFIANSIEEISKESKNEYEKKLEEIIEGKPVQYITHHQEFMGLEFYIDENVLIPQPDTEVLVETAIKMIKKNSNTTKDLLNFKTMLVNKKKQENEKEKEEGKEKENATVKVLDLCTGSGCIGISIANYTTNAQITLSDVSKQALEIAKKNIEQNRVEQKVQLIHSNLFEKIEKESFDYIVSNPPYIETNLIASLPKEVQNEPHIALDGGSDGLKFYKDILNQAQQYLKQDGYLLLEIGYRQSEKIINLWKNANCQLELITKEAIKDFGGNDRVLVFQKQKNILHLRYNYIIS